MRKYLFIHDPNRWIGLHINREYNENIPQHQRYEWYTNESGWSPLKIESYNNDGTRFVFRSATETFDVDLIRMICNDQPIILEKKKF